MAVTVRVRPVPPVSLKFNEELIGSKNGSNRVFAPPEKFKILMGLRRNGHGQHVGTGGDAVISESGGLGTGYDTVTFDAAIPAPVAWETLLIDYIV